MYNIRLETRKTEDNTIAAVSMGGGEGDCRKDCEDEEDDENGNGIRNDTSIGKLPVKTSNECFSK